MINKKAKFSVMTFLTQSLVFALIFVVVFAIWGGSGGFGLIVNIGQAMAKIPAWAYLALGVAYLFGKMIGK